jgi:hypothetical protein
MADIDNDVVSTLSKKIDDQARFTRIVAVICCLAIIGCLSYAISSLIYALPDLMLAKVMSNMEALQIEWKAIDKLPAKKLAPTLN